MHSWLYKLTTGNFVTNKTLFTTFQKSHWLKFARCLCNAESRCFSTTDFRRWSITVSHNKQNNSPSSMWNVPVAYFLVRSWAVRLGRKVGTSWSKKQRAFSLRFLWVGLSVSFNWLSSKETTFCRKATNFAYFSHLYFLQISAIQIGLSEPICDSLRMRLVPGPRHVK